MTDNNILVIRNKHHYLKILIGLLALIIVTILAYSAFLVSISINSEHQKYFFGLQAYSIDTSSMEPELKVRRCYNNKKMSKYR